MLLSTDLPSLPHLAGHSHILADLGVKATTCKTKAKAKDLTFKAKAKDLTFEAKAKAKDLIPEHKVGYQSKY